MLFHDLVEHKKLQNPHVIFSFTNDNIDLQNAIDSFKNIQPHYDVALIEHDHKFQVIIPVTAPLRHSELDELRQRLNNLLLAVAPNGFRSKQKVTYTKDDHIAFTSDAERPYTRQDNQTVKSGNKTLQELQNYLESLSDTMRKADFQAIRNSISHSDEKERANQLLDQYDKYNTTADLQAEYLPLYTYRLIDDRIRNQHEAFYQYIRHQLTNAFIPSAYAKDNNMNDLIHALNNYITFGVDTSIYSQDPLANLCYYDVCRGYWSHDLHVIKLLLSTIINGISDVKCNALLISIKSNIMYRSFKPYHGSRYVLFKNGVYDAKQDILLPLDSPLVKRLHFSQRSYIRINYQKRLAAPVFDNHARVDEAGDDPNWTPARFINAYGNNNEELETYFLFLLSLGLFGNHNFGMHVSIKGESRWGKSKLARIFRNLYSNIQEQNYASLNNHFAFTNLTSDTSIIWLNECNTGKNELNDGDGIRMYDSLADDVFHYEVKSLLDRTIENPPQVFVDGTSFVQASDMSTGPVGRTLPYQLPHNSYTLQKQSYSKNIDGDLDDERTLQYLVTRMFNAYRHYINESQMNIDNVTLSIKNTTFMHVLPKQVQEWRNELVASDDVLNWLDTQLVPCMRISNTVDTSTLIHRDEINMLYMAVYKQHNPQDSLCYDIPSSDVIWTKTVTYFTDHNYQLQPVGSKHGKTYRKQVRDIEATNLDWDVYRQSVPFPEEYAKLSDQPSPFKQQTSGWYAVINQDTKAGGDND